MPNINTWLENNNYTLAKDKTLTPNKLVTYLQVGSDFTTGTLSAGTPTKLLIPTTQKTAIGFEIQDLGGGNLAYVYTGTRTSDFKIFLESSIKAGANNTIIRLSARLNGIEINGVTTTQKTGIGSDVADITVSGSTEITTGDYIEVYAESSLESTITFIETSIDIFERD